MKITDMVSLLDSPNKLAVVDGDIHITYQELYEKMAANATLINELSDQREHIAILLPNSANYVVAFCSILHANCTVVPIYYKATTSEIEDSINYCDINFVITDKENLKRITAGTYNHRIQAIDINTFQVLYSNTAITPASVCSPSQTAVMLGTSGSTSAPKRVMLSHDNLIENAVSIVASLRYGNDERFLCLLPLTFASGNTSQLVVSLVLRATLYIYHEPLHPKFIFNAIEKYGITTTTIVPSILKTILSDSVDRSDQARSLKVICFGGGPTDDATLSKMLKNPLCDRFVHMYGQTEASTRISHLHFSKEKAKLPSVGQPLLNINAMVDITEADGKSGEILVSGPNVMLGYYKEKKSPVINGWLATGDIGYIENGYIYITGRKKNIIIYSGMNIYAEEVENVICQFPGVKETVVYGQEDAQFGEVPVAEVVVNENEKISENALRKHCANKLSSYKIPIKFSFVDALQRTYNGKISRNRSKKDG